MKNPSISAALNEIIAAYNRPTKSRYTLRLSDRELATLKKVARGGPASAALEQIVAAYMESEMRPERRDKSVKKGSFFINASLLEEVHQLAAETKTTASELMHAALRDAEKIAPTTEDDSKEKFSAARTLD